MSSFDPMAAAIDWLDAYRAADLSIADLYAEDAALECGCDSQTVVIGRSTIAAYWRLRFVAKPACDLESLQTDGGEAIVMSYAVPGGLVQAAFEFNDAGEIIRSRCGPVKQSAANVPSPNAGGGSERFALRPSQSAPAARLEVPGRPAAEASGPAVALGTRGQAVLTAWNQAQKDESTLNLMFHMR